MSSSIIRAYFYTVKYDVDNHSLGMSAAKIHGIVREFFSSWRVVTLCLVRSTVVVVI